MLTSTVGQIGVLGQRVQSLPHGFKALSKAFERLRSATVERVRVIELAQLNDQIMRLTLACVGLRLLDGVAPPPG